MQMAGCIIPVIVLSLATIGASLIPIQFGSSSTDELEAIVGDNKGNLYVCGYTTGSMDEVNAGVSDLVFRKYNPTNGVEWAFQIGGGGEDLCFAGDMDKDGNGGVFFTGEYTGDLAGSHNQGNKDMLVIKLNSSNGAILYAKQFGDASHADSGRALIYDKSNDVVWAAGKSGITFSEPTNYLGDVDAFVVKLNSNGDVLWSKHFGGTGEDMFYDMDLMGGHLFLGGLTRSPSYSGVATAADGTQDSCLSKIRTSDGGTVWSRVEFSLSSFDEFVWALTASPNGDVYTAAWSGGSIHGESRPGATGDVDAAVTHWFANGTRDWTVQVGTTANDWVGSLRYHRAGFLILGGTTIGALPGHSLLGQYDMFVITISVSGGVIASKPIGTPDIDIHHGNIVYQKGDSFVLAGSTTGNWQHACQGSNDMVYVKLVIDCQGVVDGTDPCPDCNGAPHGDAVYDACGVCGGDSRGCCSNAGLMAAAGCTCDDGSDDPGEPCGVDCSGTIDECLVCDGDNRSCCSNHGAMLAGVCLCDDGGDSPGEHCGNKCSKKMDACGICGGDGTSCACGGGLCKLVGQSCRSTPQCGDEATCVDYICTEHRAESRVAAAAITWMVICGLAVLLLLFQTRAQWRKNWHASNIRGVQASPYDGAEMDVANQAVGSASGATGLKELESDVTTSPTSYSSPKKRVFNLPNALVIVGILLDAGNMLAWALDRVIPWPHPLDGVRFFNYSLFELDWAPIVTLYLFLCVVVAWIGLLLTYRFAQATNLLLLATCLPLFGSTLFMPIISGLASALACDLDGGRATSVVDHSISCYSDRHVLWICLSIVAFLIYVPTALSMVSIFQRLQKVNGLTVVYSVNFLRLNAAFKSMAVMSATFLPRWPVAFAAGVTIACLLMVLLLHQSRENFLGSPSDAEERCLCNNTAVLRFHRILMGAVLGILTCGLAAAVINDKSDAFTAWSTLYAVPACWMLFYVVQRVAEYFSAPDRVLRGIIQEQERRRQIAQALGPQ